MPRSLNISTERRQWQMARNKYDVDEIIEEQFDVHQLLRLGKYVAPHKKKMFLAAVLMLSSSALTMLIPIFFM